MMTNDVEERLAASLTAETTELLPFLPYLLQDLWALGSSPKDIAMLIKKHIDLQKDASCVVFGAAGNALGSPAQTLDKLAKTVKPGGYIIIDEAYLLDGESNDDIKYKNYEYLYREQWLSLFKDNGLELVEELQSTAEYDFDSECKAIASRANELSEKHPEKREIFERYVQSQLSEVDDLESRLSAVYWLLRRT